MSKNSQFSSRPEWCMGLGKSSRFNFGFLDDRTVTYAVANTIVSMDVVSGKSRCSSLLTSLVDYTFTQGAFILCISSLVDKHRHFHLIDAKTNLVGSLDEVESNATLIDVSFEADNRFVIACLCGTSESSWISLLRNGQWTRFRQDQTPKQVLLKDGLIILTQDRISSYLIGADTSLTPHWNFEFKSDSLNRMSWLNDTSLLIGDQAGQIFQMDVNQTEQSHLVHNIRDELIKLEKQLALYAESNKRTSKLNLIDLADDSEPCEEDATCDESQTIDSAGNLFDVTIRHINQILNGFVCVCGANKLAVFKKDSLNQYKLTSVAQLPHNLDNFKNEIGTDAIEAVQVSPNQRMLVCFTSHNLIYKLDLEENYRNGNKKFLSFCLVKSFHYRSLIQLNVCSHRPLVVSLDDDSNLNVWNYKTQQIMVTRRFEETALAACIHPTGLYLAVSFANNQLNLYFVILDQLKLIHSFKINQCNGVEFSPGGNLLGAVNGNTISLMSVWTFELVREIKVRVGKIQHFEWVRSADNDDEHIAGCTNSGLVCIWNAYTGERLCEYNEKQAHFKCLVSTFTPGNDKLHIIALDRLNTLRVLSTNSSTLYSSSSSSFKSSRANLIESDNNNNKLVQLLTPSPAPLSPPPPPHHHHNRSQNNYADDLQLERLIHLKTSHHRQTCFALVENQLLIGDNKGQVTVFNYLSLSDTEQLQVSGLVDNLTHSTGICQLTISANSKVRSSSQLQMPLLVLSASQDGLILISSLRSSQSISSDQMPKLNLAAADSKWHNVNDIVDDDQNDDDILITKSELAKLVNYETNLRKTLVEQSDEQNYALKLKDMLHKEHTKTLNYEAKLNLTRMRGLFKETKQTHDEQLKLFQFKLENFHFILNRHLESMRERAITELNRKFELSETFRYELTNLLATKRQLEEKFADDRQSDSDPSTPKLDEIETSQIRTKRDIIDWLRAENRKLELAFDQFEQNFRQKMDKHVEIAQKSQDDVRIEAKLTSRKIVDLSARLKGVREAEKGIQEAFTNEKFRYLNRLDSIGALSKRLNELDAELKSKQMSQARSAKRLETLKKSRSLHEYQHQQTMMSFGILADKNTSLRQSIYNCEEYLRKITQKKNSLSSKKNTLTKR